MYIETLFQRNVWWGARGLGKAELSVSKLNTCSGQASDCHQAERDWKYGFYTQKPVQIREQERGTDTSHK